MLLERMELADIGNPRKMAAGVLNLLPNVVFPLPVEEIALALEIRQVLPFDTDSFEGALLADEAKSNCMILVRSDARPERRRFTVGHELGHYLMPLHIPTQDGFRCTQTDMQQEEITGARGNAAWEAEANTFAAELLMPPTEFKRKLRAERDVSIEALTSVAHEFGVSKMACGRRIMQLSDDPCAMLISKDGILKQVYRHAEFPYIGLQSGMAIPRDALARTFNESPGLASGIESTEPSGWRIREKRELEVYEQVLSQTGGWRLTLLTAEFTDDDDEG